MMFIKYICLVFTFVFTLVNGRPISIKTSDGHFLSARGPNVNDNADQRSANAAFEKWRVVKFGNQVAFQSIYHKSYLSIRPDNSVKLQTYPGSQEKFTLVSLGNNKYRLKTYNNRYLRKGSGDGGQLSTTVNQGTWEQFEFVFISNYQLNIYRLVSSGRLSICEIEVYSRKDNGELRKLEITGAYQSSTDGNQVATRATDGVIQPDQGPCAKTNVQKDPFWKAYAQLGPLGLTEEIAKIVLYSNNGNDIDGNTIIRFWHDGGEVGRKNWNIGPDNKHPMYEFGALDLEFYVEAHKKGYVYGEGPTKFFESRKNSIISSNAVTGNTQLFEMTTRGPVNLPKGRNCDWAKDRCISGEYMTTRGYTFEPKVTHSISWQLNEDVMKRRAITNNRVIRELYERLEKTVLGSYYSGETMHDMDFHGDGWWDGPWADCKESHQCSKYVGSSSKYSCRYEEPCCDGADNDHDGYFQLQSCSKTTKVFILPNKIGIEIRVKHDGTYKNIGSMYLHSNILGGTTFEDKSKNWCSGVGIGLGVMGLGAGFLVAAGTLTGPWGILIGAVSLTVKLQCTFERPGSEEEEDDESFNWKLIDNFDCDTSCSDIPQSLTTVEFQTLFEKCSLCRTKDYFNMVNDFEIGMNQETCDEINGTKIQNLINSPLEVKIVNGIQASQSTCQKRVKENKDKMDERIEAQNSSNVNIPMIAGITGGGGALFLAFGATLIRKKKMKNRSTQQELATSTLTKEDL